MIPYPEITANLRKVAGNAKATKAQLAGALWTAITRLEFAEKELRLLAPIGEAIRAIAEEVK